MNLVVVEDSELVLQQLLRLIAENTAITVAGIAADEESAISIIRKKNPDVVMLDLSLSSGNGINVLKRMRAEGSSAKVLILSNYITEIARRACESHGINGFYDKSHQASECLDQLFSWAGK